MQRSIDAGRVRVCMRVRRARGARGPARGVRTEAGEPENGEKWCKVGCKVKILIS